MQTILKNHETIEIRDVTIHDALKRHHFFVTLSLEQVGVVHTADEIDPHTEESEQQIKDFLLNRRGLWRIALNKDQEIVGEIDITVKNLARIRHNGFLTMGIIHGYQNLGLGSALMQEALQWAKNYQLERVELSVFKDNKPAQALYTKFGFVVEGTRKNYIKNPDGSYDDDLLMATRLRLY